MGGGLRDRGGAEAGVRMAAHRFVVVEEERAIGLHEEDGVTACSGRCASVSAPDELKYGDGVRTK